jgi:hypothetical protein
VSWLNRILGRKPPQSHGDEAAAPRFELRCSKCAARYCVGEDAIVVTMQMATALMDSTVTFASASPSAAVQKDLVSLVSGVPAERRASVLSQARDTMGSVRASLGTGQMRVWICHQCKAQNDYANGSTDPVARVSPATAAPRSKLTREQGLMGVAYSYVAMYPRLCEVAGGALPHVKEIADGARELANWKAPEGGALTDAIVSVKQMIDARGRAAFLGDVRTSLSGSDATLLMVSCMRWINGERMVWGMKVKNSPKLRDDSEMKKTFRDFLTRIVDATETFGGELGFSRHDLQEIDKSQLMGMFFVDPAYIADMVWR